MKRSRYLFMMTMILTICVLSVATAGAENRAGSFTITPSFGYNIFEESDLNLEDAYVYGGDLNYNLTENFGLEAAYRQFDSETDDAFNIDVNGYSYRLDLLYHFMPENALVPYVALGGGALRLDPEPGRSDTDPIANYALGLKYFLTDDLALRADARHTMTFPDNILNLTAGLTYYIGGTSAKEEEVTPPPPAPEPEPAPAPAPVPVPVPEKDTDGDGVLDSADRCPGTPKGAFVDERGCWVIKDLQFDFNKSEIKPQYYPTLDNVITVLRENPQMRVEIDGHTDSKGTDTYNLKLSERRAKAVVDLLVKSGIDATRLTYKGLGESSPAADNATEEGRAKNRRVEITPIF